MRVISNTGCEDGQSLPGMPAAAFTAREIGCSRSRPLERTIHVGVSALLRPGLTVHTRTLLRALATAINLYPQVRSLRFHFADDGATPTGGCAVARRFVQDGVDAVIGPFGSDSLLGAVDVYAEAGIPIITPAATVCVGRRSELVFRLCPDDQQIARYTADRIRKRGLQRVRVVSDRSAHARCLRALIEAELGGDRDFATQEIDAFVYTGRLSSSQEWVRQTRSRGNRLPIILTDDAAVPELLLGIEDPGDLEIVGFRTRVSDRSGRQADHAHLHYFGETSRIYFLEVLSAALIIAQASQQGGTITEQLRGAAFQTPLGTVNFSDVEAPFPQCGMWYFDHAGELVPETEWQLAPQDQQAGT